LKSKKEKRTGYAEALEEQLNEEKYEFITLFNQGKARNGTRL
jgi:hypothetical protein